MLTATRFHDISVGHRVMGPNTKCRHLHGHNYRIHFTLAVLDASTDMVLDFGIIKSLFCVWLENNWDHKFLVSEHDPWLRGLNNVDPEGVCTVPFNPTAENMAKYLVEEIAPQLLEQHPGVRLKKVVVDETRKCSATFEVA